MKAIFLSSFLLLAATQSFTQGLSRAELESRKKERLQIDWPEEYHWKMMEGESDSSMKTVVIYPGTVTKKEELNLVARITAYRYTRVSSIDSAALDYKTSLAPGSTFTLMEKMDTDTAQWIFFRIETPPTAKLPFPESDLFFLRQGKLALYECMVAIRQPRLDDAFLQKWLPIFKSSRLIME